MPRTHALTALALLAGLAVSADARPIASRPVAVTGATAPGVAPAATFSTFTLASDPGLMRPSIDATGRAAITVGVRDTATSSVNLFGVWAEQAGSLRLVALQNDFAPGCQGLTFGGFPSPTMPLPPSIADGRVAFLAALEGPGVTEDTDLAVFVEQFGFPMMVAREGDPIPSMGTNAFVMELGRPTVNASGAAAFAARGFNPVTCTPTPGLWSTRNGGAEPVISAGDAAVGAGAGVSFANEMTPGFTPFSAWSFTSDSTIAFTGRLAGPGVTGANNEGIWAERNGVLGLVVREGQSTTQMGIVATVGDGTSPNFGNLGFNAQGGMIFTADMRTSAGVIQRDTLWADWGWGLQALAHPGGFVFFSPGAHFDRVLTALLNENSEVAFVATLTGSNAPSAAVFYANVCSQQPMARAGQSVPGATGVTIDGGQPFAWLGFNNNAQAAILANLSAAGAPAGQGLLLATPDGTLHTVARVGQQYDSNGAGLLRTIASITPGAMSNNGKVAFRLDFTDGASGFFTAGVGSTLVGDANGDGVVDFGDLNIVLWQFGQNGSGMLGDVNADGLVNFADLNIVLANYGHTA